MSDSVKCSDGIREAREELAFGNIIYIHNLQDGSYSSRFEEVLFDDYGIYATLADTNKTDSCFKTIMDSVITSRFGKNVIDLVQHKADSLDKVIPSYQSLDSTYKSTTRYPTYPGGYEWLNWYTTIQTDSVTEPKEIFYNLEIDTLGHIKSYKLLKRHSRYWNDSSEVLIREMLPWTPAYSVLYHPKRKDKANFHKVPFTYRLTFYLKPKY